MILTPNELILNTLAEECLEVAMRILKRTRFGEFTNYPGTDTNNNELIIQEIGDMMGMLSMVIECGILMPGDHSNEAVEHTYNYLEDLSSKRVLKMRESIKLSQQLGACSE